MKATWPKLIGYGKADTFISKIDRRNSDGFLAMCMESAEPDLFANAAGVKVAYMLFDPNNEQYKWIKIIEDLRWNMDYQLHFTPDGSKILASFFLSNGHRFFVYFDAANGNKLAAASIT